MSERKKHFAANEANWDERVGLHAEGEFYDLERFKKGGLSFVANENEEVGDVVGKSLLHLQCHFGLDTLSWSRLGAKAVGLDFSEKAIQTARTLNDELSLDAEFICGNVYDAPKLINRQFDVVFTSVGVLCWLPDLKNWAKVISQCLKPGGLFYIKDGHPFVHTLEQDDDGNLLPTYPYFHNTEAQRWEEESTYASSTKLENKVTYEWDHKLSDILNSLIGVGLIIERVAEYPDGYFQAFPNMRQIESGEWVLPENLRGKIPLVYAIWARKPLH